MDGDRMKAIVLALLLAMVSGGAWLHAQVPQGQILGTVMDSTGATVPNASVTLKNELTGITRTMTTTSAGEYVFPYLDSGSYTITVQVANFDTSVQRGILVQVATKQRVDVQLKVGQVQTTVEVTGKTTKLDTDSATVGTTVSRREVLEIPLNGRDFSQLATLLPGVRNVGSTGGALITQFGTAIAVGGTDYNKNSYSQDGVDNTFNVWNGPAMNPSIDSIQELRIERNLSAAEFGRGGAQMQVVTKSGTNNFHGAVWEYLRNAKLNAGNYISHVQDTTKRNQFGFNLGGPIIKNKAFFFFNYEGQRERSSVQPLGSVPTDLMRAGDLSELYDPEDDSTWIHDPLKSPGDEGYYFPNNVIPSERLNQVSLDHMNAMSAHANLPGIVNNYQRPFTTSRDWNQYIGRVDFQLSDKDRLFYRFNGQTRDGLNAPLSTTSIPLFEDMSFYNTGIGWNRSWTARFMTETRLSYHGERILEGNQPVTNFPPHLIKGFDGYDPPRETLPFISAGTYHFAQWGFPWHGAQNTWELVQNLTWVKGSHVIKAGFVGRSQELNRKQYADRWYNVIFASGYTGNAWSDFLLGYPNYATETLPPTDRDQVYGDYAGYVQDDWKVTRNLTLNLGLRYELANRISEKYDRWGSFSPSLQKLVLAGDRIQTEYAVGPLLEAYSPFLATAAEAGLPTHTLVYGDHNNWAPRVGFAWRPRGNNKMVVRGGYGIYYMLGDGNNDFSNAVNTGIYGGNLTVVNDPTTPVFTIDAPFGGGGTLSTPPPLSPRFKDPYMRDGYLQQATLGIQYEFPWGFVGEINWQDQHSLKLETGDGGGGTWLINKPQASAESPNPNPLPYPDYSESMGIYAHEGHMRYDALELSVKKTSRHFTMLWSHTYAKNIGRTGVLNPYNRDQFEGPMAYLKHVDKVHFVADLPFGKGRHWGSQWRALDHLAGGWTVSALGILHQSGSPFSIGYSGDPTHTNSYGVRADRVCNGKLSNPTMAQWFDTSCFVVPANGTWGNAGTGILTGPGSFFMDLGVYKSFNLREGMDLQFRTEMFNAFNHPNLGSPGTTVDYPNFGVISTKDLSPRVIQFALRLNF